MEHNYMVSYQLYGGLCGNCCGSLDEVLKYREENKENWISHSLFKYITNPKGISDLIPIDVSQELCILN